MLHLSQKNKKHQFRFFYDKNLSCSATRAMVLAEFLLIFQLLKGKSSKRMFKVRRQNSG